VPACRRCDRRADVLGLQLIGDQRRDLGLVVDDQDVLSADRRERAFGLVRGERRRQPDGESCALFLAR